MRGPRKPVSPNDAVAVVMALLIDQLIFVNLFRPRCGVGGSRLRGSVRDENANYNTSGEQRQGGEGTDEWQHHSNSTFPLVMSGYSPVAACSFVQALVNERGYGTRAATVLIRFRSFEKKPFLQGNVLYHRVCSSSCTNTAIDICLKPRWGQRPIDDMEREFNGTGMNCAPAAKTVWMLSPIWMLSWL